MIWSWPVTRPPSAPSSATLFAGLLWTRLRCSLLVHPSLLSRRLSWLHLELLSQLQTPFGRHRRSPWCEHLLSKRVPKASSLFHAIGKYEDAHGAFTLLRSCTGWAKILYSCRTVPPTLQPDALAQADADVRDALGRLVGSPLSADDWRLPSLGISAGGIGARSAREPVRHGRLSTRIWPAFELPALSGAVISDESLSSSQKALSSMIEARAFSEFMASDQVDVHRKAHLVLNRNPNAGAWLTSLPNSPDRFHHESPA